MTSDLLLIILAALLAVALLRLWARRRAAERAARQAEVRASIPAAPVEPEGVPQPAAWTPPRYEASRHAVAGPALRVGINIIRARADTLLVSWNAHNVGSLPVAVQWGAPEVVRDAADSLQLRYTYEREQPFIVPEARVYQPGEILSRSATVAREVIGQELGGLRVTVAVGYGNANEHDYACADRGAYLDWQQVAVSPPRIVPRG